MTEVPDKQTEGTGRGRGRGRSRDRDREPAVAAAPSRGRGRSKPADEAAGNGSTPLVALPGERLSKTLVGGLTEADLAAAELFTLDEEDQELVREGPVEVGADAELGDGDSGDAPAAAAGAVAVAVAEAAGDPMANSSRAHGGEPVPPRQRRWSAGTTGASGATRARGAPGRR